MTDMGRNAVHLWSLREDLVVQDAPGGVRLLGRGRPPELVPARDFVRRVLHRMELGPIRLSNVWRDPGDIDTHEDLASVLDGLAPFLIRSLGSEDARGTLLSVRARQEVRPFTPVVPDLAEVFRLAHGCEFFQGAKGLVCDPPDLRYRLVVHRAEPAWVMGSCVRPCTVETAVRDLPLATDVTRTLLGYLAAAGVAVPLRQSC